MTDTTATSAFEDVVADSSAGAGFEAVMAHAALAGIRGLLPPSELTRFAWAVVRHPKPVASRIGRLATRLIEVGRGQATKTPGKLDRRFTDRAWADTRS